jgi:hypothetical protein
MVGIIWPAEITMISEKDADHNYLNPDFKGI